MLCAVERERPVVEDPNAPVMRSPCNTHRDPPPNAILTPLPAHAHYTENGRDDPLFIMGVLFWLIQLTSGWDNKRQLLNHVLSSIKYKQNNVSYPLQVHYRLIRSNHRYLVGFSIGFLVRANILRSFCHYFMPLTDPGSLLSSLGVNCGPIESPFWSETLRMHFTKSDIDSLMIRTKTNNSKNRTINSPQLSDKMTTLCIYHLDATNWTACGANLWSFNGKT